MRPQPFRERQHNWLRGTVCRRANRTIVFTAGSVRTTGQGSGWGGCEFKRRDVKHSTEGRNNICALGALNTASAIQHSIGCV